MLLLTSDGLTSPKLIDYITNIVKKHNYKNAVLIVNANKRFKKDHSSWQDNVEQLKECGLDTVLFDLDTDSLSDLETYDVVFLGGGNPFYLLLKIKQHRLQNFFEMFNDKGLIIGVSGGALVLQETLSLIDVFASDMNMRHGGDLVGLGLIDIEFLPHKTRYEENFDSFSDRVKDYEKKYCVEAVLLEDGEGIFYDDELLII